MNDAKRALKKRLASLPKILSPVQEYAAKYLNQCCAADGEVLLIGHLAWVNVNTYLIQIFPPATEAVIEKYEKQHKVKIPELVRRVLLHLNGCFFFGIESLFVPSFSIFGLAPSMSSPRNEIDRTARACHDIGTANTDWINSFSVPSDYFYFGSRPHNSSELAGFFVDQHAEIVIARQSGKILNKWHDLPSFFNSELALAEKRVSKKIEGRW